MNLQELIKELQKYGDRPYSICVRTLYDGPDARTYEYKNIISVENDEGIGLHLVLED